MVLSKRFGCAVLVEIGGDLRAAGVREKPWVIAVAERAGDPGVLVTLAHGGLTTSTLLTLLVQQRFGPKLSANARLFTGLNEYPNKDLDVNRFHRRSDFLLGAGLGLDYQIQRWLGVGADYTFSDRQSNFRNFDYTDHILGVKITFSL